MIDGSDQPERPLSIGELAEQTGVSRRTVRFYVQRGVIDPPIGLGRSSHYTQRHVGQVRRVLELQRRGLQLSDITAPPEEAQESSTAESSTVETPETNLVLRVTLMEGVRLELDAGAMSPTAEQLRELAAAAERILIR